MNCCTASWMRPPIVFPMHTAVVDGDARDDLPATGGRGQPDRAPACRAQRAPAATGSGCTWRSQRKPLACLYGVLKAGAAYVPLAPDGPTLRLAHLHPPSADDVSC